MLQSIAWLPEMSLN